MSVISAVISSVWEIRGSLDGSVSVGSGCSGVSGNSGVVEAIICGGIGIGFSLTFVYLVDTIGGCGSADVLVGYGSGYGIGGIISGRVWAISSVSIRISVISAVSTEVKGGGIGIGSWGSIGFGVAFAEMVGISVTMSIGISVISVVSAIAESVTVSVISAVSVAVSVMAVVVCGGIGIGFGFRCGFRCSFGIGRSFAEMVTVVSVVTIGISVISVVSAIAESVTVSVSVTVSMTVMAVVISGGIGVSLGLSGHDGEEGNCKDSEILHFV